MTCRVLNLSQVSPVTLLVSPRGSSVNVQLANVLASKSALNPIRHGLLQVLDVHVQAARTHQLDGFKMTLPTR